MENIFKKIGSELTLSQVIEQRIENAIVQKIFKPGQKLPSEFELSSMFGVSRTAVREALRMLSARGLISVRKGSGNFINDFSTSHASKPMSLYLELNFDKDYIMHVIKVRQIVEPALAGLAAKNRTDEDIRLLKKNMKALSDCDPENAMAEAELDLQFHTLIANASCNPIIPVILQPLYGLMPKIKALVIENIADAKTAAVEYHQKIVDQIIAADEQGAIHAMIEHLKIAEEHSAKYLQRK